MMATSLVFSPSTLPTSYVSIDTMPTTTTTTTPSSTSSASPTTTPVLATTTLPVPTEPPEPPCCKRVNGLCEWVEPECEHLDESIRKNQTWTEEMCDEIHPDDITEYQERFQMYKDMLKRQKFARVKMFQFTIFHVFPFSKYPYLNHNNSLTGQSVEQCPSGTRVTADIDKKLS